jgi:hypothetical protein
MESQPKDDLTEAVVITELMERDVPVSTPFGNNERYDMVIESPTGSLLRTQVKTGWFSGGTIRVKGHSQHTNSTGNTYELYDSDDIDYFLAYCHELETMCWIEESAFGSSIHLRVDEPEQVKPSINWAADYEFDATWPPE